MWTRWCVSILNHFKNWSMRWGPDKRSWIWFNISVFPRSFNNFTISTCSNSMRFYSWHQYYYYYLSEKSRLASKDFLVLVIIYIVLQGWPRMISIDEASAATGSDSNNYRLTRIINEMRMINLNTDKNTRTWMINADENNQTWRE